MLTTICYVNLSLLPETASKKLDHKPVRSMALSK